MSAAYPPCPQCGKVETTCAHCGKTFVTRLSRLKEGKGLFCSRACHDESRRKNRVASCVYCGASMKPARATTRFCSKRCVALYRHRDMHLSQLEAEERERRKKYAAMVSAGAPLTTCPFASGAITMPDGGRVPDAGWGW